MRNVMVTLDRKIPGMGMKINLYPYGYGGRCSEIAGTNFSVGRRKEGTCFHIISGIALAASIAGFPTLPFDAAWVATLFYAACPSFWKL